MDNKKEMEQISSNKEKQKNLKIKNNVTIETFRNAQKKINLTLSFKSVTNFPNLPSIKKYPSNLFLISQKLFQSTQKASKFRIISHPLISKDLNDYFNRFLEIEKNMYFIEISSSFTYNYIRDTISKWIEIDHLLIQLNLSFQIQVFSKLALGDLYKALNSMEIALNVYKEAVAITRSSFQLKVSYIN